MAVLMTAHLPGATNVKPLFPTDGPIMPSITIDQLNEVVTA